MNSEALTKFSEEEADARIEEPRLIAFDRYVLDLHRGALRLGRDDIEIRPKVFEVLKFLVANAGRLVSKRDIIDAVWHDVFVTDDSLVQCVGELRRALGEDGKRLVTTVPRRGYRLDLPVADMGASSRDLADRPADAQPGPVADGALGRSLDRSLALFLGRSLGRLGLAALCGAAVLLAVCVWRLNDNGVDRQPGVLATRATAAAAPVQADRMIRLDQP